MALYIRHSIFHLARLLYVRPENFGPYYVFNFSLGLFVGIHVTTPHIVAFKSLVTNP